MRVFRRTNFYISLCILNSLRKARALIARMEGLGKVPSVRVLLISDGKLLFVRHYLAPGLWMIPGGRMDAGELPENAAKREVKEETGLDIESFNGMIGTFSHPKRGETHVYHTTRFNGALSPTVKFEIKECRWFPLHAVPEEILERDGKYIEMYLRATTPQT